MLIKKCACCGLLLLLGCQSTNAWLQNGGVPLRVPPPSTGSYAVPNQYSQNSQTGIPSSPAASQFAGSMPEQLPEVTPSPPAVSTATYTAQNDSWTAPNTK